MPIKELPVPNRLDDALQAVRVGRPVRVSLPGGGRLHIDRRLPFLCLHRRRPADAHAHIERFLSAEAAHLDFIQTRASQSRMAELVRGIATAMSQEFGAFLLMEIWADASLEAEGEESELEIARPVFNIVAPPDPELTGAVEKLSRQLGRLRILRRQAQVKIVTGKGVQPPGMRPLLTAREAEAINCHTLGLAVRPIHLNPETGEIYPLVFRRLRRQFSRSLRRAIHAFALESTRHVPVSYQALGRRRVARAAWEIDNRLAEIANAFDFILQVTPVNIEAAFNRFRSGRFKRPPVFRYRPIPFDPVILKRRLFAIPIEQVEDPALEQLFREKQLELDRQLTMLLDRGRWQFLHGSIQIYGDVDRSLRQTAQDLLARIPRRERSRDTGGHVNAEGFAARAQEEIIHLREQLPALASRVEVRSDLFAGLMVSRGNLLVGKSARIPPSRVEALIQHEVGTHVVTHANGDVQPMRLLALGLAGYEELQEGLAVLAEHLVGGLSRGRLRTLAARVLAVWMATEGSTFTETFLTLDREWGFDQKTAFTIAARVYRGGGLTKDAVYLRGLIGVLEHLQEGGSLEPLYVGKIGLHHLPIVKELLDRRILRPPPLKPRHLTQPSALNRLERLRSGMSVFDLLESE